jgi:hypothetical protein
MGLAKDFKLPVPVETRSVRWSANLKTAHGASKYFKLDRRKDGHWHTQEGYCGRDSDELLKKSSKAQLVS